MLRTVLSVIAGVLVGFFVITLIEAASHFIFPPPEGLNPMDAESIKLYMKDIPIGALLLVWFSYVAGSFVSGLIAAILSRINQMRVGFACGLIMLIAGSFNLYMIPHPLWFSIGTILTYIPLALAGSNFGKKIKDNNVI